MKKRAEFLVGLGIALYIAALGWIGHLKYVRFIFNDFDLAVHAQSLWALTHGSLQSSILGIPFLGNHLSPILFLLAPIYRLIPSAELLLLAQTAVLASGAWALFRLARRELSAAWGLLLAFVYLVYPPLIQMNLFEFHPVALASGFLLWMLDAYHRRAFRTFAVFLALALLCQENVALIIAFFSLAPLIERRTARWILTPLAAGLCYAILAIGFLMPALNPDVIQFGKLYAYLGDTPADILRHIVFHPVQTAQKAFTQAKLHFFNQQLAPLGYLSLVSPVQLIPTLPALAQRLLSARTTETMLRYHYQAEFIPFVFAAAVFGIRRLLKLKSSIVKPAIAFVLVAFSAMSIALSGFIPELRQRHLEPIAFHRDYAVLCRAMLDRIPADASVISTFEFLPKLSARSRLYSLHHVYTGHYTLSDRPYPTPGNIDWVLINTLDRNTFGGAFYRVDSYTNLQQLLASASWTNEFHSANLLAFRRLPDTPPQEPDLCRPVTREQLPALLADMTIATGAVQNIELKGFTASNDGFFDFYWERLDDQPLDYLFFVRLFDHEREIGRFVLAPGHRIWPPPSWKPGDLVKDRQRLPLENIADPTQLRLEGQLIPINRP